MGDRAVDKARDTVDFLLTAKRDAAAALRFLRRAIAGNAVPVKVNIDAAMGLRQHVESR